VLVTDGDEPGAEGEGEDRGVVRSGDGAEDVGERVGVDEGVEEEMLE
jgi:hypothetical protein